MQCLSFVIEAGSRKIVYSGDLSSLDDIIPILTGADSLVIDGMHIDLSRLPEAVIEAGVRKVLLTHVAGDFDFDKVRSLFQKQGVEDVYLASEGLEIAG